MVELTRLDVSHNALTTLDPAIASLAPSLRVFLARYNQLSGPQLPPDAMASLQNLIKLDLTG